MGSGSRGNELLLRGFGGEVGKGRAGSFPCACVPGDYEPTGPTAFVFHLFLFAEHDQLTILTQEVSLQTNLLIL